MRICGRCKESKDLSAFYRASRRKDGYQLWCKQCATERRHSDPNTVVRNRRVAYKKHYGISLAEYEAMFDAQGGLCAICGLSETHKSSTTGVFHRLSVDHDHVTGKVRSLLCRDCNTAIGLFKEDLKRMANAIQYLERTA